MSFVRKVSSGLKTLFRKDAVERDLDDELRHYLAESATAHRAAGMTPEEAERAARLDIGSVTYAKDPARSWGWESVVEAAWQDLRYAARRLRKNPGFTLAAACSLALGIGANTAIFSMVNATLIQRLPVTKSEDLVNVYSPSPSGVFSYPSFDDIRRGNTVFGGITAFGGITVSLSDEGASDLVGGAIVTGNFFDLLGVKPAKGRLLSVDDDRTPGAHPVAVISAGLWKRRFGSRSDIVGTDVRLNGQPFKIVGVAPPKFYGAQQGVVRDLYVPMMMQAWMRPPRAGYSGEMDADLLTRRTNSWLYAVGRRKPGLSDAQLVASLNALVRSLPGAAALSTAPSSTPPPSLRVAAVDDGPPGQREQFVSVARLLGAVVIAVLIIACANVANLLLARAATRRKEIAVRLSMGASRGRLVRQLLTESVLLSALGGGLGLALAWGGVHYLHSAPPPPGTIPVTLDFAIDARVLAFTFGLSVLTGLAFGLVPALRASRPDLVPALKDQSAVPRERRRRFSARNGLVVAQVALSLVLLISAGLFLRSVERARAISPGLDVNRLLTTPLNIQLLRYTRDQGKAFYRDVVERVSAVPGVASASLVRWVPLGGGGSVGSLHIQGQAGPDNRFGSEGGGFDTSDPNTVSNDLVGLNYFATMGIAITKGRDFSAGDMENAPLVAIVNESFARRHFPGEDAIGKRISLSGLNGPWREIVGVTADGKYATLDEPPMRLVYLPIAQNHVNGMTLVVRAQRDPASVAAAVGREVQALDKSLPIAGTRTMTELLGLSLYAARAGAALLSLFGGLALLLAAVGLYGVMSYAVSRRTREIGLRMALGAQASNILTQVLGEGMMLVVAGVAGGLIVSLSVTHLLARFLYGVSTTDGATFTSIPALLLGVALLACLVPAWRATKVDPIRALKQE